MRGDRAIEPTVFEVDRDRALEALGRGALIYPELHAAATLIDRGADPVVVLAGLAVDQARRRAGFVVLELERLRRQPAPGMLPEVAAKLFTPGPAARALDRFLERLERGLCPTCAGDVELARSCADCGGRGRV